VRGNHNKLGEGERKVRLGQDSLPNIHFCSGNEQKVGTLFYPHPFFNPTENGTPFTSLFQYFHLFTKVVLSNKTTFLIYVGFD
jgi:hypothetical protein